MSRTDRESKMKETLSRLAQATIDSLSAALIRAWALELSAQPIEARRAERPRALPAEQSH
jgi:hypothetical protein